MRKSPKSRRKTPGTPSGKAPTRKPERSASIIGAGRMGTALALALKAAGYQIEIVVTKRASHARQAAKTIGGGSVGLTSQQLNRLNANQLDRLRNSSLVLIATPDDAIAQVAAQLATIFKSAGVRKAASRRVAI